MAYRIGIDAGGTFTDLLLYDDDDQRLWLAKTPTTPRDQSVGVLRGIDEIGAQAGIEASRLDAILHGTTAATNTVLEKRGARVGAILTAGFRHLFHLAEAWTPGPLFGFMRYQKPEPLVDVEQVAEVEERIGAAGEIVRELDAAGARAAIEELVESGVESLTVCLLNAYVNPVHERAIAELAAEIAPGVPVSLSSDVMSEFREYERAVTTVMNSYVAPEMDRYLAGLQRGLDATGAASRLQVVRSDGGLMSLDAASALPVHSVVSGPAGGVSGASHVARIAGFDDIITFDMGGTSTDVAVCHGGAPAITRETRVGEFPVRAPSIDLESIGAGGGSIAAVADVTGALRVGPRSAGADPGPACYAQGGAEPTVTDANVVVGHLPPRLLGGQMELDVEAAHAAIGGLAEKLGLSTEETAAGILRIVNESMLGALRVVTVQKGHPPEDFALVAFGGAGPLHANALAETLGCFPVLVPHEPGVLSAMGFVASDVRNEYSQTYIHPIDEVSDADVADRLAELAGRAERFLDREDVAPQDRSVSFLVDMRYHRQGFEIPIEVESLETLSLRQLAQAFTSAHERLYGFGLEGGVEVVNLRAVARGRVPEMVIKADEPGPSDSSPARSGTHQVWTAEGKREVPVYDRARLEAGMEVEGYAIVEQYDSTTVVLPGHTATVDPWRNLLIRPSGGSRMTAPATRVDPVTLDLTENALLNLRFEMDEVVRRAAMSPMIRVQHDEFPMICNREGKMVVGQFGSYIPGVVERFGGEINEGDVVLFNDPYLSEGSITHCNDWCLIVPIFHEGEHVAFASMFGHMMDVGGKVPGSQVNDAASIWDEGCRIPPIKIVEAGVLNETALDVILNNTRTPDMNRSDLMALIGGCRVAERRVIELCDRFGASTFEAACDALLERTRLAITELVRRYMPEHKLTFTDLVDDDGCGNGPFKIVLTLWREGDVCHVDWTGTDPQAPGSINFRINEGLCKLFFAIYLIMAFDPEILFNDGAHEVFEVTLPEGTLLNPRFPAPVSNRLNVHVRFFDCMSGALGQAAPDLSVAAGYGASPYFVFSGTDDHGRYFQFVELLFGGIPARPLGDGLDGHSWWPLFQTTPAEYTESYYPVRIERYVPVIDSGGAGLHRGGTGVEKEYVFKHDGEFTVTDDRTTTQPWGVGGGRAGGSGRKLLIRGDGERIELPAKADAVPVEAGDRLVFRTAGSGGWGDPLERPAERVLADVRRELVSREAARDFYGVVIDERDVDEQATAELREELRARRGYPARFDYGELSPAARAKLEQAGVDPGAESAGGEELK